VAKNKNEKKRKKMKPKDSDFVVLNDIKEPWTWNRFYEEVLLGNYRKIKRYLDERGVIFFLTSPFQYRNRLILRLVVIVLCVLGGIIPRSNELVKEARARNAASELSAIKDRRFFQDKLGIVPLKASHANDQHVIAFLLTGDTKDDIPSTTEGYNIYLSAKRGVTGAEEATYRYGIIPMDTSNRLLILYVDQRQQTDKKGVYGLNVTLKGQKPMENPMEIVLSDTQEQTDLFNGSQIDLSALSPELANVESWNRKAITETEKMVAEKLKTYRLTEERLAATQVTLKPSLDELNNWVKANSFLATVRDDSTTAIVSDPITNAPKLEELEPTLITADGSVINTKTFTEKRTSPSTSTLPVLKDYPIAQTVLKDVITAVTRSNEERLKKYQQLYNWSVALNSDLGPQKLNGSGKAQNSPLDVQDIINRENQALKEAEEKAAGSSSR
jgi:hypothetical protein